MKQKWYLRTWFICILFTPTLMAIAIPLLLVFPVIGIILILMQNNNNKKFASGMFFPSLVSIFNLCIGNKKFLPNCSNSI